MIASNEKFNHGLVDTIALVGAVRALDNAQPSWSVANDYIDEPYFSESDAEVVR
jgi:hypothetical protein